MTRFTSAPPGLSNPDATFQGLAPLVIDCRPSGARHAFTLVELMVAMTLTLFVMVILTQSFVTSLDVFDDLKGIGDMEAKLRNVAINLRADLSQHHFEGARRLCDPGINTATGKPKEGFFYLRQSANSQSEGADLDGIDSKASFILSSGTVSYHALYFTNRLAGNQQSKVYSATVPAASPLLANSTNYFNQPPDGLFQPPGNRFNSQWAAIAYYLVRTGTTVEKDNPSSTAGTPLHALYRSECPLVPNTSAVNPATPATAPIDQTPVSCIPSPMNPITEVVFNNPADVTDISRRELDMSSIGTGGGALRQGSGTTPPAGSTLLATNVVSFNVRVLPFYENVGLDTEFRDLPHVFDTNNPQQWSGVDYRLHALEITIRVWDTKTEQSRQVTVVHGF